MKKPFNRSAEDSDSWDTMSITSAMSDELDLLSELDGQEEEAAFSNQSRGLNDEEQESVFSTGIADRPKQLVSFSLFHLTWFGDTQTKVV